MPAILAIDSAYHRLVHELELARDSRLDQALRLGVIAAARDFQAAIAEDGGARPRLAEDAKNIAASLDDGSFSAGRSLAALARDARGNALEAAPWHPAALVGSPVPATIGTRLDQASEGDCVGISVIKAFSATPTGAAILQRAVRVNADGSYNVNLPGAPDAVYRLAPAELDQFGHGDPAAAAMVGAFFHYFGRAPSQGALPTNKVMELLAGQYGTHARLPDAQVSPQALEAFLLRSAPEVGRRTAMVFGGKPGRHGEWTRGDGHAFAVLRIDPAAGTVTYTNPWNEEQPRRIAIAELARQAAGTSADFETITFR